MKSAGVWSRRSLRPSSRWLLAAAALVLLAGFSAPCVVADGNDAPITAADADRMAPLSDSVGSVAPAAPAPNSSTHAIVETAPALVAAPLTSPAPAPIASTPNPLPAPVDISMPEMPSRPTIQMPSVPPLDNAGGD